MTEELRVMVAARWQPLFEEAEVKSDRGRLPPASG